jgi:hypothetical protein
MSSEVLETILREFNGEYAKRLVRTAYALGRSEQLAELELERMKALKAEYNYDKSKAI